MKTRAALAAIAVLLLLLGSGALAQPGGSLDGYTVEGPALSAAEGTASGGGYHLTALSWQVGGRASGQGYLLSPSAPALLASGCCCTYLPCVQRNH